MVNIEALNQIAEQNKREMRDNRFAKTADDYETYKAKQRERMRKYRAENPEKAKQQTREAQRRYRERLKSASMNK